MQFLTGISKFKATDMRLRFEYLALLASLILVLLEAIIHLITFCLRKRSFLQYSEIESNY